MSPSISGESFLAFTLAMFLLALSPGPGFLLVVARALGGGFTAGLAAIAGLVLGDLLFLAMAILGLSALAAVMGEFFMAVKIFGAAYLIWLGVKTWCSRSGLPPMDASETSQARTPHRRSAALGFFVTLGNPKVILFYGALLPTFVDVAALTPVDVVVLAAVVTLVLFLVLSAYAFLAGRTGRLLKSPCALTWLNRATGGLLIGAGVAMATR